jgi:hypothetical protein
MEDREYQKKELQALFREFSNERFLGNSHLRISQVRISQVRISQVRISHLRNPHLRNVLKFFESSLSQKK